VAVIEDEIKLFAISKCVLHPDNKGVFYPLKHPSLGLGVLDLLFLSDLRLLENLHCVKLFRRPVSNEHNFAISASAQNLQRCKVFDRGLRLVFQ